VGARRSERLRLRHRLHASRREAREGGVMGAAYDRGEWAIRSRATKATRPPSRTNNFPGFRSVFADVTRADRRLMSCAPHR
jgi:hypothetical protein